MLDIQLLCQKIDNLQALCSLRAEMPFSILVSRRKNNTLGLYTRNEAIVRFARVCCLKHKGGLAVIKGISK